MVATVLAYTGSLFSRLAGARGAGVALANTGLALLSAGAYLGGDEVFDLGYPVNHTAFAQGPDEFTPVLATAALQPGTPTKVDASGVAVMLVRQGDAIYALDDTCVHNGCSLSGGRIQGDSIICPCHGSQYDLRDGSVINGPATMPEPRYEVRVKDGKIEVKQG
jgi:nitrite reductase/ring-hydroxylating ferredoxin subunit